MNVNNIYSKKNFYKHVESMGVKSRLIEFIDYKGMSRRSFSLGIGASSSFVNSISKSIGTEYIDRIKEKFPELNISWLLTGEGDMLIGSTNNGNDIAISSGKVIPYYDAEVAAGTNYEMEMAQTAPVGMIEIGGLLKDSEFAMRVYGNSMVPNYPAGCVIGLRQYNEHFIEPGTVYVIETEENRFLKRLYYSKDKKAFRCMSDNHMKHETGPMEGEYFYPEFEIPFEDVRRLLRVTGVVKRNIM